MHKVTKKTIIQQECESRALDGRPDIELAKRLLDAARRFDGQNLGERTKTKLKLHIPARRAISFLRRVQPLGLRPCSAFRLLKATEGLQEEGG